MFFERYAIDLAALNQEAAEIVYKPRERSTGDLILPDTGDAYYRQQRGRFRAELHDRLSAWMFPLASVFIAFAALGDPRTTRQGRTKAVVAAVVAVVALRIALFAGTSALVRSQGALVVVYGLPVLAVAVSTGLILGGPRLQAALAARLRTPLSALASIGPRSRRLRRA